jgi:hypothetical protein
MRAWMLKSLALALGVGLFLAGLIWLGEAAREDLREQQRCLLPFADVACSPPPGLNRGDFLDEVRYLANVPQRLNLLDPDLATRLAQAFAQHPWVARVERVEVLPPSEVRVQLRYRRPALAVPMGGQLRVVDEQGILLPRRAPTAGLPVFHGKASSPAGPAGTAWGDPAIVAAARKAGLAKQ